MTSKPSATTPAELRARAAQCEQYAKETTIASVRETMLMLAERWRRLADNDEAIDRWNPGATGPSPPQE